MERWHAQAFNLRTQNFSDRGKKPNLLNGLTFVFVPTINAKRHNRYVGQIH
jgi:hypothetical protein